MRLPQAVDENSANTTKKKSLEAVNLLSDAGTTLQEFGTSESGNCIQTYVKVSKGNSIAISFELPCTEIEIVDVFIDGVLRESMITTSIPSKAHRGKILEACVCMQRPSGEKGKMLFCNMVVEDRKTTEDIDPATPGYEALPLSAVGTIEVRVLRELKAASQVHMNTKMEQAKRGPTFEDYMNWWDVTRRVDHSSITPTFQIGFINGRKTYGSSRKNIKRSIEGYYLWASFKFLYRSADDIQVAGFECTNNLPKLSSKTRRDRSGNSMGSMESLLSTTNTIVDKKPTRSQKRSSNSAGRIGSDSSQRHESELSNRLTNPVAPSDTHIIKQELQMVTPGKCSQVLDEGSAANKDSKVGGAMDSQRNGVTDIGLDRSCKTTLDVAKKVSEERPPTERQEVVRMPTSMSRRAAIAAAEQVITSYAEESTLADIQINHIMPVLSQASDTSELHSNDIAPDHFGGNNSLDNNWQFGRCMQERNEKASQAILTSLTAMTTSPQTIPPSINETVIQERDHKNSVGIPSTSLPSSLLQMSCTSNIVQGPGSDRAFECVDPDEIIFPSQPVTPTTMITPEIVNHAEQSSSGYPNSGDIERQAKAMTNGKGDWRGRVTQLVHKLAAPPMNRAIVGDSISMATIEQPMVKDSDTVSLSNSLFDMQKKRKYDEINVSTDSILRPIHDIPPPVSSQKRHGMSLKDRREELARKKQAKQEALKIAKADADLLRRQVQEMEAEQTEAVAREELELEELDMELENVNEEQQALAARLRELSEL